MKDFRRLMVWQKSHVFVLELYRSTKSFPREELYGLTSQIRRAAVSIPSNIVEGCGRQGDAELGRFFQIAMGSAREVEYQLLLARDLEFISNATHSSLEQRLIEIKKMLNSFIQKLKANR